MAAKRRVARRLDAVIEEVKGGARIQVSVDLWRRSVKIYRMGEKSSALERVVIGCSAVRLLRHLQAVMDCSVSIGHHGGVVGTIQHHNTLIQVVLDGRGIKGRDGGRGHGTSGDW